MLSICTYNPIQWQCVLDPKHLVFGKATLDSEVEKELIEIRFVSKSMLLSVYKKRIEHLYMNVYNMLICNNPKLESTKMPLK